MAPGSPEPLQTLAQLHHEAGQPEQALAALRQSMARWWHGPDAAADGSCGAHAKERGDRQDSEAGAAGEQVPSYEFRMECCKLLIELDETTTTAVQVRASALYCYGHTCMHRMQSAPSVAVPAASPSSVWCVFCLTRLASIPHRLCMLLSVSRASPGSSGARWHAPAALVHTNHL